MMEDCTLVYCDGQYLVRFGIAGFSRAHAICRVVGPTICTVSKYSRKVAMHAPFHDIFTDTIYRGISST